MSVDIKLDAASLRLFRQRILTALEAKSSWGQKELRRLVEYEFLLLLEETAAAAAVRKLTGDN